MNISGVDVHVDQDGLFNLNDLHEASGGANKHRASFFMRRPETIDLIAAMEAEKKCATQHTLPGPVKVIMGRHGATYVCKELVYAYAMWVKAEFHLKVIRKFEQISVQEKNQSKVAEIPNFDDPVASARAWADAVEQKREAEKQLALAAPKVEALARIAKADGSLCFTDAAKQLQIRRKDLLSWLSENKWIYRRRDSNDWIAYQERIQSGVLEHKVHLIAVRDDGSEKLKTQALITAKGLTKLAKIFAEGGAA